MVNKKIEVYIGENNEIFKGFYSPSDYNISNELEEYLMDRVSFTKRNDDIDIEIKFNYSSDKEVLKRAIKNTFNKKIEEENHIIKKNNIICLAAFILGIIIGALVYIFSNINISISQLLSIVCWVFIWYGVETYFFENRELKVNVKRYKQILNSNIY
ncbi:MAG: hypothetical protein ACRDCB_03305 [Clostridium sp.]|uniref:hypothetical protein n=1 Tax=Clostridium TaxID=1485 RepID=UPI002152D69B|nr:hypothetical protein [Clostridium sp. LY3-2]MCR6516074.1 hypothetical protein [Clostridium sp. LY3-2]